MGRTLPATMPRRRARAAGSHRPSPALPPQIAGSPLMRGGGFGIYEGLIAGEVLQQLLGEAVERAHNAAEAAVAVSDDGERGGTPARRFMSGPGGAVQLSIYHAPGMLAFLRALTDPSLEPTGGAGTYSYYVRPGDFLALHRDIVTCDVSVITCLSDRPAMASGGELVLYPGRWQEPLTAIRSTPRQGARHVKLREGQTLVFYGGIVPHQLLPVAPSQARIVSVLCYRTG